MALLILSPFLVLVAYLVVGLVRRNRLTRIVVAAFRALDGWAAEQYQKETR